jgi:creatinine amidohydrolase
MSDEPISNRPNEVERIPDRSWYLEDLPWPAAGRLLARDPRLIFPVGALVQHGPHLPLGTNTTIVEAVAKAVSARCGVLLAPTLHFGVRGPGKERFAGSAGLQRKTLHRAINELLAEWEDHGIREFLLLTAHQFEPHLEALLMAMTSAAATTVVNLLSIAVGDLLEGAPLEEHAGELETSLMLHLAPSLVQMDQATDVPFDPETSPGEPPLEGSPGTTSSRKAVRFPSRASARKGAAVFERYVESVAEIISRKPHTPR